MLRAFEALAQQIDRIVNPTDNVVQIKSKKAFDQVCGVKGWTLHDLRRTARSLMSRGWDEPRPCRAVPWPQDQRRPRDV